jgi:ABC-type Fe3+-citrate transport system substrate-binding protein
MDTITLDQAIDTVMQLSFEQREMLIEIIRRRDIENRRKEIAKEAQESMAAFHAGELKPQPSGEVITELRKSLVKADEV